MARIEDTIQMPGYAWLDDEGDLIWCTIEELDGDPNRPEDATPVIIEFTPTNDWVTKHQKDHHEALSEALAQLNQFKNEYENFLKRKRIDNE